MEALKQTKSKTAVFAALFALGIILILVSGKNMDSILSRFDISSQAAMRTGDYETDVSTYIDTDAYSAAIEKKLTEIISAIDGVSAVSIMVTSSPGSAVYASDESVRKSDGGKSEEKSLEYVFGRTEKGGETPILLCEAYPKVTGVAVVCKGGADGSVRERIIGVISCALNLPTNRIFVTQ